MLRNILKDEKDKLRKKNIIRMHAFIAIEIAIIFDVDDVVDIFVQVSLLFKIFMLLLFCLAY